MEQDVKIGSVGDVKIEESAVGEKATGSVKLGPVKIYLSAELDNKDALAYLAAQVPGGFAHDGIVLLQKVLFPEAAPSA